MIQKCPLTVKQACKALMLRQFFKFKIASCRSVQVVGIWSDLLKLTNTSSDSPSSTMLHRLQFSLQTAIPCVYTPQRVLCVIFLSGQASLCEQISLVTSNELSFNRCYGAQPLVFIVKHNFQDKRSNPNLFYYVCFNKHLSRICTV